MVIRNVEFVPIQQRMCGIRCAMNWTPYTATHRALHAGFILGMRSVLASVHVIASTIADCVAKRLVEVYLQSFL